MGKSNWHEAVIGEILKNSFYCGIMTYHKEITPNYLEQKKVRNYGEVPLTQTKGTHTPIVTVEEFNHVQELMAARRKCTKKTDENGRYMVGTVIAPNVWSRIGFCQCGAKLNKVRWRSVNGVEHLCFRCRRAVKNGTSESRKKRGLPAKGGCDSPMVYGWKMDAMARYIFDKCIDNADEVKENAWRMIEREKANRPEKKDNSAEIRQLEGECDKLASRYDRLYEMRAEKEITHEYFIQRGLEIQRKTAELKVQIEQLQEEADAVEMKDEDYDKKLKQLHFALNRLMDLSVPGKKIPDAVVELFIKEIVVYPDHYEWHLNTKKGEKSLIIKEENDIISVAGNDEQDVEILYQPGLGKRRLL
ncbi:MAG: recombinase family protein [Clostridia bacterium]|nr:recombinase family protein [Clostridia bacterium]